MNVAEFVSKWQKVELTERSASQQHFLDLCEVFEHPKPALDDPTGEKFTFEKGADKHGGGHGWADVWKRGFFGWEYKGKHKGCDIETEQVAKRTLTNLYNERPTWLDLAHRKLDEAVFAAYGWEPSLSDDEILAHLLVLNQERASATPAHT